MMDLPKRDQHVKIFFRNGLIEEGYVISWTTKKSVIKSLSTENLLIIQNTEQDVIAIKIFVEQISKGVYIDKELQLDKPIRDPGLRALNLAELRLMRANEERERARELMTTFKPIGMPQGIYGAPRRLQKPPKFDTTKKDRIRSSTSSELYTRYSRQKR